MKDGHDDEKAEGQKGRRRRRRRETAAAEGFRGWSQVITIIDTASRLAIIGETATSRSPHVGCFQPNKVIFAGEFRPDVDSSRPTCDG